MCLKKGGGDANSFDEEIGDGLIEEKDLRWKVSIESGKRREEEGDRGKGKETQFPPNRMRTLQTKIEHRKGVSASTREKEKGGQESPANGGRGR